MKTKLKIKNEQSNVDLKLPHRKITPVSTHSIDISYLTTKWALQDLTIEWLNKYLIPPPVTRGGLDTKSDTTTIFFKKMRFFYTF